MTGLLLICAIVAQAPAPAGPRAAAAPLRPLIEAAVQARLGAAAVVSLDAIRSSVRPGARVDGAKPEPGVRNGGLARFALLEGGQPVGYVVAQLHVSMRHLRTAREMRAGEPITAADVVDSDGDPGSILLEAMPDRDGLDGAIAARPMRAGEPLTTLSVRIPPAVRSGERVAIEAVLGGVTVAGVAVALQSGKIGEEIRLVNPDSRRQLRGRIVGKAKVQVIHGS